MDISTHTLTWSVTRLCMVHRPQTCHFNSHAHVERDSDFPRLAEWIEHFNSHAHVERDRLNQLKKSGYYISTHTLTWSVTQVDLKFPQDHRISTHTLTWSVTLQLVLITKRQVHFNSHAHVERDSTKKNFFKTGTNFNSHAHVERDVNLSRIYKPWQISTHTLTWSVTNNVAVATLQQTISTHTLTWSVTPRNSETGLKTFYFNSHAHVERDYPFRLGHSLKRQFQLTRSRGAWLIYIYQLLHPFNFNSHAHVERDSIFAVATLQQTISTHTLTWSVTATLQLLKILFVISTHTLTWSVTRIFTYFTDIDFISTHTLTWSVTLDVVYIWCLLNVMRTYFFI